MSEEKWKEDYKIRQKQNEIAEEIKNPRRWARELWNNY